MADSSIPITGGSGYNVDTRTATNGDHREVVVTGDANTDAVATVNTGGDRLSSITSKDMAALGVTTRVSADGKLWTITDPTTTFYESFDANAADPNRWVVTGTNTPSFASGAVLISAGTGNSGTSVISTTDKFSPLGLGFLMFGAVVTLEATQQVNPNVHRYWGMGQVTSYSTSTPLTDGAGFEVGIDGALSCVVYVGGTRYVVNSTTAANISTSVPAAGGSGTAGPTGATFTNYGANMTWAAQAANTKRYFMQYRPDAIIFYVDTLQKPVAAVTYLNPNAAILPIRVAAATTPATSTISSTVVFTCTGVATSDSTRQNQTISDPTYPWRRAQVGKFGGLSIKGATQTATTTSMGTSTGTAGPVDVTEAGNATFIVKSTSAAAPYAGAPVLVFEQSDDSISWSPLPVMRAETGQPLSTHLLPAGVANGELMFDASLEGVSYTRVRVTTAATTNGMTIVIQPNGQASNPAVTAMTAPLPNATSAVTSVTSAAADTSLLAANLNRRGATVYNDSTAILYLLMGTATSSTTTYSLQIPAGGYYEVPFGYSGQLKGIWSAANGAARVTEITG